MNKGVQKEINTLFKKLGIDTSQNKNKNINKKSINDYKLQTKFPTKFSSGNLSITNSTK